MIPEAPFRPSLRLLLHIALLCAGLSFGYGQEGGAFGLKRERLAEILAAQDISPVLALREDELGEGGAYGDAAPYYLARWIDSRIEAKPAGEAATRARLLYRMAYDEGAGIVRREAGIALMKSLGAAGLWEELLAFAADCSLEGEFGWSAEGPRLEALDALGLNREESTLAAILSSSYPEKSAQDALAYFSAAARLRSGADERTWSPAFRRLLLDLPPDEWSARAYLLVQSEPRLRAAFSEEELHALAMRDAIRRRDYGAAYREAVLAQGASLSRAASRPMVSDAGKAFLYSGKANEGEALFTALEAAAAKPPAPQGPRAGIGWTALYYRGRFALAQSNWDTASRLFKRATAGAPTREDADSCLWYATDSAYKAALAAADSIKAPEAKAAAESAARGALLEALVAASAAWSEAETFSDLADLLFRDALFARDWSLVESIALRLGDRLDADTEARVSYAAARAFELGLGSKSSLDPAPRSHAAAVRFAAIADEARAPFYYRALAAWRAGVEPLAAWPEAASVEDAAEAPREIEAFLGCMLSFGLGDLALSEARSRKAELSGSAMRRLALRFASLGRPDCAIRLILDLSARKDYSPRRADYELLYPRPYLGEIRALRLGDRLPESLAFGLIRSESIFKADALSRAGAIGLTQLMPATAAEQARALRLKNYDLRNPEDNLAIGLAHFASLLRRTDGRPLRAMMAYNAGWGRLKSWILESGDLPDDLMVEALRIEETRQYCRNIFQAAAMYDRLYYGRNLVESVENLIGGSGGH